MQALLRKLFSALKPPERISTEQWANEYRFIAAGTSAFPGKYNTKLTPWVSGILEAIDDKTAPRIVCMKSAQVAWTDGVMNNAIGKRIDIDPCPMIIMFPKMKSFEKYHDQKLVKMIEATPRLRAKVDTSSRKGNRKDYKAFDRGFLQLIASNSADEAKSTPAPFVAVEEPDDCNANIAEHGDSLKLLEQRTKTYSDSRKKILIGGTPTVKGLSTIEDEYKQSDQRQFWVPCHECGEQHVLTWENVLWDENPEHRDEVYGHAIPSSARYACPHCGGVWDDHAKNRNVRKGVWKASKPFRGVAGFHVSELYAPFPDSRFQRLVERYLEAKQKQESGDDSEMMVFSTHALGLPFEVENDAPSHDDLLDRALDYEEKTVPMGGLVLTAGIDVQHDRLAIIIRAHGRMGESWLVYWGEISGACADRSDSVWLEANALLFGSFRHASGAAMRIEATTIDSSDGQTNDAVYSWVRQHQSKGVMAGKGWPQDGGTKEIFSKPRAIDTSGAKNTKASRYGLMVYMVGTHRAKDLISARLKMLGDGPGRMHSYKGVRADYFEQVTSEVLVPAGRNKKTWEKLRGVRNEGLDCEVYAEHAARSLKLHIRKPDWWDNKERQVMQADLFREDVPTVVDPVTPVSISMLPPKQNQSTDDPYL